MANFTVCTVKTVFAIILIRERHTHIYSMTHKQRFEMFDDKIRVAHTYVTDNANKYQTVISTSISDWFGQCYCSDKMFTYGQ